MLLAVLVLVLAFLSVLQASFDVDVCTIFCATIGKQKKIARAFWFTFDFRFPRSNHSSSIFKISGLVRVEHRLSFRSGLTAGPAEASGRFA